MSALARPAAGTRGVVNYMAAGVTPSLYRNGRVLTRRDADGSDGGSEGIDVARVEVEIRDARSLAGDRQCTLHDNGFELLQRPLAAPVDFFDHDAVVRGYYADCAATVEAATGARAWAFDHNVRSATGKRQQTRIRGGQQVQGPAHMVHGDYTLHSAPQRLRDLTRPPALNDTLRGVLEPGAALLPEDIVNTAIEGGRFAIINVWRNIAAAPVATHPLALCDGQSVAPDDLVVFEIHYADRIGENYFARHAPGHAWYYYPAIAPDEALLIKQWDSAGELARSNGARGDAAVDGPCTFSFHTAFEDPATPPDAPDRCSIEVRCAVIFD